MLFRTFFCARRQLLTVWIPERLLSTSIDKLQETSSRSQALRKPWDTRTRTRS
jgi:hypothetical protein